tara:strand:+ start:55 stop:909 length:855 start_codon:yes stop_codon:yes gene_type:complete
MIDIFKKIYLGFKKNLKKLLVLNTILLTVFGIIFFLFHEDKYSITLKILPKTDSQIPSGAIGSLTSAFGDIGSVLSGNIGQDSNLETRVLACLNSENSINSFLSDTKNGIYFLKEYDKKFTSKIKKFFALNKIFPSNDWKEIVFFKTKFTYTKDRRTETIDITYNFFNIEGSIDFATDYLSYCDENVRSSLLYQLNETEKLLNELLISKKSIYEIKAVSELIAGTIVDSIKKQSGENVSFYIIDKPFPPNPSKPDNLSVLEKIILLQFLLILIYSLIFLIPKRD